MNEEAAAIKEIKEIIVGNYEYPSILNEIKKTNYGNKDLIKLWNAIDDESSNYLEYSDFDIAKAIVYLVDLIEKQQKQIEELKYHIHYKICAWCGDEFKTKIHNARYCPKCRETKRREIRISNCKKHYENNKDYFKNYYQNLTDEQKERRRANNREANRRLRERKKCK